MSYQEEIIDIKGMHCKSCVDLIELKIRSLGGVEDIKVSLIENKAFIKFDPEKINLEKIKSEINSLGFNVYKINNNQQEGNMISTATGKKKNKTIQQGIIYGIIPHIGCIAFIVGSILGVTVLMNFFKPFLMNRYFFHILILISLLLATFSSVLYLRKNGLLSWVGIKIKQKYLLTMFGSTIMVNLLLFFVIFPLIANVSAAPSITGAVVGISGNNNDFSLLKLKVDIPCPGHAPLISNSLKSINGVIDVKFSFPNVFDIKYDSTKTSEQNILSLDVFKTYKATVLNSVKQTQITQQINNQQPTAGGCGCGGCGG